MQTIVSQSIMIEAGAISGTIDPVCDWSRSLVRGLHRDSESSSGSATLFLFLQRVDRV